MKAKVNKIRNPDFSAGKDAPQAWKWRAADKHTTWHRPATDAPDGVVIQISKANSSAGWVQHVRCKPGEYYLVAATVSCDLATDDESGGFFISVQPLTGGRRVGPPSVTPGLHRTARPTEVRAYFQAPQGVREVELAVESSNARGTVQVHSVRFMSIVEPDEESHTLALPQPVYAEPAKRAVRRVGVCTAQPTRPLVSLLESYLGSRNVAVISPNERRLDGDAADSLLFPDPDPPMAIASLRTLERLASEHIVVISLPAFAKLSGVELALRRVEQPDDPIHAKVRFADAHTRGFALIDVFAYSWRGKHGTSFVQTQFRKSAALSEFCTKHEFEPMLLSMCCQDNTSDRPICLYKPTKNGGLFVLDIEPVEAEPSTYGEPAPAMTFLLSVLGQSPCCLGQYVVAERKEAGFRERIREMGGRFAGWVVHEDDLPADEVTQQLVTIGGEEQSYGLPLLPKPLIMVRSGLQAGDAESIYGAFLWFKQLVRMPPFQCPYVESLISRFRLAWVPSTAPWERREGFRTTRRPPTIPTELEIESGSIAALLDVVSCPVNRVRVVVPSTRGSYERFSQWLPRLSEAFPAGAYFAPTVAEGDSFADRAGFAWRKVSHSVEVVADPQTFSEEFHGSVIDAGGQVFRLEVPGSDFDFTAHSMQRTDLAATLLEHTIGLLYGLIAVNRRPNPVTFNGFPPMASGQALILRSDDPLVRGWSSQVG